MLFNKIIILGLVFSVNNLFDFAESKVQLTEQESRAVTKLRVLVNQELSRLEKINEAEYSHIFYRTDDYLLKWLRARDLSVNEAFKMFQAAMKWRIDNRIDSILNESIFNFTSPTYTFGGVDKERRPLLFLTVLHVDFRKLLLARSSTVSLRLYDQMLERAHQILKNMTANNTLSDDVPQFMVVAEANGFNLRQHFCLQCTEQYFRWLQHLQIFYPNIVKKFVIVNMPRIAIPLLELIRPVLSRESREALVTFSTHKPEWSKYLLTVISADQLPYRFGGTKIV